MVGAPHKLYKPLHKLRSVLYNSKLVFSGGVEGVRRLGERKGKRR